MLDVVLALLLLINKIIFIIAIFVNVVVRDMIIIVLGHLNVLEKEIFFILMQCLLWLVLFLFMLFLLLFSLNLKKGGNCYNLKKYTIQSKLIFKYNL